jgi:hypothetical protein
MTHPNTPVRLNLQDGVDKNSSVKTGQFKGVVSRLTAQGLMTQGLMK